MRRLFLKCLHKNGFNLEEFRSICYIEIERFCMCKHGSTEPNGFSLKCSATLEMRIRIIFLTILQSYSCKFF